jgi:hypothetical protein
MPVEVLVEVLVDVEVLVEVLVDVEVLVEVLEDDEDELDSPPAPVVLDVPPAFPQPAAAAIESVARDNEARAKSRMLLPYTDWRVEERAYARRGRFVKRDRLKGRSSRSHRAHRRAYSKR